MHLKNTYIPIYWQLSSWNFNQLINYLHIKLIFTCCVIIKKLMLVDALNFMKWTLLKFNTRLFEKLTPSAVNVLKSNEPISWAKMLLVKYFCEYFPDYPVPTVRSQLSCPDVLYQLLGSCWTVVTVLGYLYILSWVKVNQIIFLPFLTLSKVNDFKFLES